MSFRLKQITSIFGKGVFEGSASSIQLCTCEISGQSSQRGPQRISPHPIQPSRKQTTVYRNSIIIHRSLNTPTVLMQETILRMPYNISAQSIGSIDGRQRLLPITTRQPRIACRSVQSSDQYHSAIELSRRHVNARAFGSLLAGLVGELFLSPLLQGRALAANLPEEPPVGDCTDCIGEVNATLNACPLESESCVSTLNDDEAHFAAPWSYDGPLEDAVAGLVDVATGGRYDPGLQDGGISNVDASLYVVKGVLRVLANQPGNPERPKRRLKKEFVPFDGVLKEKKSLEGGGQYVRIVFGLGGLEYGKTERGEDASVESSRNPADVIDAEFLFLPNDSIVNVRAASRGDSKDPVSGKLALSFTRGLVFDRNVARRRMDDLRTALKWELVPILADFDPQFNPEAPTWVEKVFKPFDERSRFEPSGRSYPIEQE